jgi:hypothetical protein
MPVKIIRKLKIISFLDRARDEFKDNLEKVLPQEILKTILSGNSPIKAEKQPRYSQSYIDQIEGKVKFFKGKNGGTFAVRPKMLEGEQTSVKFLKGGKVKQGKTKAASFEKFEKGLGLNKKVSPVNLKLSGKMLSHIRFNKNSHNPIIEFDDPPKYGGKRLSEIHNNDGVGKNKTRRRLLPTEKGEEFNANILRRILKALKDAVKKTIQ